MKWGVLYVMGYNSGIFLRVLLVFYRRIFVGKISGYKIRIVKTDSEVWLWVIYGSC